MNIQCRALLDGKRRQLALCCQPPHPQNPPACPCVSAAALDSIDTPKPCHKFLQARVPPNGGCRMAGLAGMLTMGWL